MHRRTRLIALVLVLIIAGLASTMTYRGPSSEVRQESNPEALLRENTEEREGGSQLPQRAEEGAAALPEGSEEQEEEAEGATIGGTRLRGPALPNEYMYMQRASRRSGAIDFQLSRDAVQQLRAQRARASAVDIAAAATWSLRGPTNIGGRITDIAGDRANANKFYVGAASGGVWKTSDGGASFTPIFDGQGGQAIGALALHPNDSNTLYVGTGEGNPGGGSVAAAGDGVWKTSDGGATWQHLGLDQTAYIGRIAVDPQRPSIVFVAAMGNLFTRNIDRGLYRSTDSGATWQKVLFVSDIAGAIDVAIDPSNTNRIYAAMWERIRMPNARIYGGVGSGIWRSEDGGNTWTQLTSGLPASSTQPGRIGIAIAPSSPSTVYAVYATRDGDFAGFFRSTNNGASWTRMTATGISSSSFYSTFGWWFGRLWVHPTRPAEVWADGIRPMRSTNGGGSFAAVGSALHADQHGQWFFPGNPNTILKGNDGGVYRSTDGGSTWTHFDNLPNTQFYAIEVDIRQPTRLYGGAQDNGTSRTTTGQTSNWGRILGGDGFVVNVDPTNSNVIYAESQFGALSRSTNGGTSFSSATSGISGRANWNTPVVIDPSSTGSGSTTTLYYGANQLFRSTNSAQSWTAISSDLTDGDPGANGVVFGTITTIAVASSNRNTIYVGTDDGNVWVTRNVGGTWTRINSGLPDRWVTRVAVDSRNDAIAYVSFSGLNRDERAAHLYRTTNFGASWTNISTNLPDVPVNDLVLDPNSSSTLYAATDVGVFVSADLGGSWAPLGTGLPEVIISDLKYVPGTPPQLFAGTYGRSMYTFDLASTPPPGGVVFADDFESDRGWTVNPNGADTATTGLWERGDPEATDSSGPKQLGNANSGLNDLVTGRTAGASAGANDIDGGVTSIRSPAIALPSSGNLTLSLSFYLAHANNAGSDDFLRVRIVGNTTTTVLERLASATDVDAAWQTTTIDLNAFAGQTIRILVEAGDSGAASLVEAAIDDVSIAQN